MENDEKCLSLNGGGSRTLCPFLPSSPSSSLLLRPLARRRSVPRRATPCDAYSLYRAVLNNAPESRRSTERRPRQLDLPSNSKFLLTSERRRRRRDNERAYRRPRDVSSCRSLSSRVSSWRFSLLIYTGGDAAASPRISPDRKDSPTDLRRRVAMEKSNRSVECRAWWSHLGAPARRDPRVREKIVYARPGVD